MSERYDWIVIGAGIIGSFIAWRLALDGRIALVDSGSPGQKATGAAAGVLAPTAETTEPGPLADLMAASLALYPEYVRCLEMEAHMNVDFASTGVLQLVSEPADIDTYRARWHWQRAFGARWVESDALRDLEPSLPSGAAGILAPDEGQVHPPKLVQAAVRAGRARGVVPYFGEPVRRFLDDGRRISGVELPTRTLRAAGGVILAAGVWSGIIVQGLGRPLPVRPVRGQILSLTMDEMLIRHVIFRGHTYLVPKGDGRLIVGATEDDAGFDQRVTAHGVGALIDIIESFGLSRHHLYLEQVWAGLRPKSDDGAPILGPWPEREGLYVANGHYRNGVLLSPITAEIVAQWTRGETPSVDITPFRPDRFWE